MDEAKITKLNKQLMLEFNHPAAGNLLMMSLASPQPPLQPLVQGPLGAIRSALVTGEYSDLKIICGAQTYKAHRVVICSQSSVFAAMCRENKALEMLDLTGDNPEAVSMMVEYFYSSDYSVSDEPPHFSLHLHTVVHAIAAKYKIAALEALAITKFSEGLSKLSDLEVYFKSIIDVYSLTPPQNRGLRDPVTAAASIELQKMLKEPRVKARLGKITTLVPDFNLDLLQMLLEENAEMDARRRRLCEVCGPQEEPYEIEVQCRGCGASCIYEFC